MAEMLDKQVLLGQYNATRAKIRPQIETRVPLMADPEARKKSIESLTSVTTAHAFREKQKSDTEPLSGLFSRRYFNERLEEELMRVNREGDAVGLVLGDVRKLKDINSRYGQLGGDQAIHSIGESLKSKIRQIDIPCRTGGDEFGVILPDMQGKVHDEISVERKAAKAALRLLQNIHNSSVVFTNSEIKKLHLDIGVTIAQSSDTIRTIYTRADDASFIAKHLFSAEEERIVMAIATFEGVQYTSAALTEDGEVNFSSITNAEAILATRQEVKLS